MAKHTSKFIAAIAAALLLTAGGAGAASAGNVEPTVAKTLWCC